MRQIAQVKLYFSASYVTTVASIKYLEKNELVARLLERIRDESYKRGAYPISYESARFLYVVVVGIASARRELTAVEVGTGLGFSTAWIAMGIIDAGVEGVIYTIEARRNVAQAAERFFDQAGLASVVRVVTGDAKEVLKELEGPFHLAFIDGKKSEYAKYLELLSPKMPKGAVLLAHNVLGPSPEAVAPFVEEITGSGRWATTMLPLDPGGLSFSVKLL